MRRGTAALGGALLAVLAAVSLNLPLQRHPLVLALPALVLFCVTLRSPEAGILATLALVPVVPVLGNLVRGPSVAPAELAILVCAAGVLLAGGTASRRPLTPLGAALALSAAAGAVGGLAATLAALPGWALPGALASLAHDPWAAGPWHAAAPLRAAAIHALPLGAYLLVGRLQARERARALVLIVFGLGAAGAWGIVEAAGGPRLWPQPAYDAWARFWRVVTTLPDHNAAAVLFILALFPAVGLALDARGVRRAAAAGAAVLLGAGLLLTGSRTAWTCAALAAAAIAVRAFRVREALRAAGLAVACAALLLGAALILPGHPGAMVRSRLVTLAPQPAVRALRWGRLPFWRTGVAMAAAHPLAGVGPGRVPPRFSEFRPAGFPVEHENLHSWPLQCLAENGVAGGFLLLLPFGPLVLLLARAPRTVRGPAAGLVPGLAAAAAAGLLAHPWLLAEVQVLFWGAAALLERSAETEGAEPAPRRPVLAAWGLLLAWGLPCLALAPARQAGEWGWSGWGWEEGRGEWAWLGPRAGLWLPRPAPGAPLVLTVRHPDGAGRAAGLLIAARAGAGRWRSVRISDGAWTELEVPAGSPDRGPLLVELRASRAECPAAGAFPDRRILALQLRRP